MIQTIIDKIQYGIKALNAPLIVDDPKLQETGNNLVLGFFDIGMAIFIIAMIVVAILMIRLKLKAKKDS